MRGTDWAAKVGEVLHGNKKLVEFCGMYRPSTGGAKATFRWQCLRCLREHGPAQYGDIRRHPNTHCCSKIGKHGRIRWGYRHITGEYMRSLHFSAVSRHLEFEVTSEYLYEVWESQGGLCAYTGYPLKLLGRQASLDRIDSKKGYVPGNVQWVLTKVNHMKWDSSEEEFLQLCRVIAKRSEPAK